jgi:Uma2 family endonuclease
MVHPASSLVRFSYSDYCAWPDDERWELIDGEAFNMSPAPARIHQDVVVEMLAQVHESLGNSPCRVYVAPFDVRFPRGDEADEQVDTVVQPDLSVICNPDRLDEKGCRGAPDWVVEVLSPQTASKDQIRKRDLYERHGVREYWLVHPVDRVLFVYRLEGAAYGKPDIRPTEGTTPVTCLPGVQIDWEGVFLEDRPV